MHDNLQFPLRSLPVETNICSRNVVRFCVLPGRSEAIFVSIENDTLHFDRLDLETGSMSHLDSNNLRELLVSFKVGGVLNVAIASVRTVKVGRDDKRELCVLALLTLVDKTDESSRPPKKSPKTKLIFLSFKWQSGSNHITFEQTNHFSDVALPERLSICFLENRDNTLLCVIHWYREDFRTLFNVMNVEIPNSGSIIVRRALHVCQPKKPYNEYNFKLQEITAAKGLNNQAKLTDHIVQQSSLIKNTQIANNTPKSGFLPNIIDGGKGHSPYLSNGILNFLCKAAVNSATCAKGDHFTVSVRISRSHDNLFVFSKILESSYYNDTTVAAAAGDEICFYTFDSANNIGQLWMYSPQRFELDLCLKLDDHAIGQQAQLFISKDRRPFLCGQCANKNCTQGSHFYYFKIDMDQKITIFPTIDQMCALLSDSNLQIIHGVNNSGKTTMLEIKAMRAASKDSENVRFCTANFSKLSKTFLSNFNLNHIDQMNENYLQNIEDGKLKVFIDSDKMSLTFEEKKSLQRRIGQTIIVLKGKVHHGLDHPRKCVKWFCFSSQLRTVAPQIRTNSKPVRQKNGTDSTKSIQEKAVEIMDWLYPGWKNEEWEGDTTFIQASPQNIQQSVRTNGSKYERNSEYFAGESAEDVFKSRLKSLEIGGLAIKNFECEDFKDSVSEHLPVRVHCTSILRNFQADQSFVHAKRGLLSIELKGTTSKKISSQKPDQHKTSFNEAIKQAMQRLVQIPELYKFVMDELNSPTFLHCAGVAFPLATLTELQPANLEKNIDQDLLHDTESLKNYFRDCGGRTNENMEKDKFFQFFAFYAAYRIVIASELSSLNKYEMYRMVDIAQDFDFETAKAFVRTDNKLILYGDPGTNKTKTLLRRAVQAANSRNSGRVIFICRNKNIIPQMKKFFSQNCRKLQRPVVLCACDMKFIINNLKPEDEMFCDDVLLNDASALFQSSNEKTTVSLLSRCRHPSETGIKNLVENLRSEGVIVACSKLTNVFRKNLAGNSSSNTEEHIVTLTRLKVDIPDETTLIEVVCDQVTLLYNKAKDDDLSKSSSYPAEKHTLKGNAEKVPDLSHLAVITWTTELAERIRSCLAAKDIFCGSVAEQIYNSSLIAVDCFEETLSHSWPVVVFVKFDPNRPNNNVPEYDDFVYIGSSRSSRELIIVDLCL